MKYAIIAAGAGSRLCAEGVERPKPLVELDGEPMLGRLARIFADCNAESLTIIVNEQMTAVADYVRDELAPSLPVALELIVKTTPDSMHSFAEVARSIGSGKFIVTTVDTIFSPDTFRDYARAFETDDSCDGMMGVSDYIDDEKPLYVAEDHAGIITDFLDDARPGVKYVSAGVYGLRLPEAGDVLADCLARSIGRMRNYQRALVAHGLKLKAFSLGKVIDVDHAGDVAKARALIKEFRK